MKFGMYITIREPMSAAYVINTSYQSLSLVIPFHLQAVPAYSANFANNTVSSIRVLSRVPLKLIRSRPVMAFGNETYKLNLKTETVIRTDLQTPTVKE
jgi:hypothetical protein